MAAVAGGSVTLGYVLLVQISSRVWFWRTIRLFPPSNVVIESVSSSVVVSFSEVLLVIHIDRLIVDWSKMLFSGVLHYYSQLSESRLEGHQCWIKEPVYPGRNVNEYRIDHMLVILYLELMLKKVYITLDVYISYNPEKHFCC